MNATDTHRQALRPEIMTEPAQHPAEQFQNTVLRPILKFQYERILSIFHHHIQKKKVDLARMDINDRKNYVNQAFQKDLALRHQLIGVVLGLLTEEEWSVFVASEKELSRRLLDLLVQRIQSALDF